MKHKFMTNINIDVEYYRKDDFELTATFSINPSAKRDLEEGRFDEIEIDILKRKKKIFNLTLTPEQAEEFIWALQKMITIGKEYRQDALSNIKGT